LIGHIEVNHRLNEYKRRARERLTSEEGIRHGVRRCVEPEAVFGQVKYNMAYRRFRHFGKDKVTMGFTFFATAFNLKKPCTKLEKAGNGGFARLIIAIFRLFVDRYGWMRPTYYRTNKKIAA
jgi:hypothetical protein